MIRAFRAGEDIHANICLDATGHRPKDEDERKIWKTVGFARVYGAGLPKIVYLTGLPFKEARDLFRRTEGIYPAIEEYKNTLLRSLLTDGTVKIYNIFGRFRFMGANQFKGVTLQDRARNALREAFNYIFQSSGHDVLKIWLMETVDMIADPRVLLINDVHDEWVVDCPENAKDKVLSAIKQTSDSLNDILYQAYGVKMLVPVTAAIEFGDYWK